MREYLRWVQYRNDDPKILKFKQKGYPVRILSSYPGTTIVGFPTQPKICTLGMVEKLVTAAEATPREQYQYLYLLEKYWIQGVLEDGVTPLLESGNQVSYSLKYNPKKVSYAEFVETMLEGQPTIRCCSVMPQSDASVYEYQPEEMLTISRYQQIVSEIQEEQNEDIVLEDLKCESGVCSL